MIIIHCPIQQEFVLSLFQEPVGDIVYEFVKKEGMKLYFNVTGDVEEAIAKAKARIKSTEIGAVLYFQITEGN